MHSVILIAPRSCGHTERITVPPSLTPEERAEQLAAALARPCQSCPPPASSETVYALPHLPHWYVAKRTGAYRRWREQAGRGYSPGEDVAYYAGFDTGAAWVALGGGRADHPPSTGGVSDGG